MNLRTCRNKVVITGANGMVGSSLAKRLAESCQLTLVDVATDRIAYLAGTHSVVRASCLAVDEWQSVLEGADCVVHLAAIVHEAPKSKGDVDRYTATNAEATKLLYEACLRQHVRRFLFFSTNDVYEQSDELIAEDTPLDPKGPYALSKLMAEEYLRRASQDADTAVCVFRPASIYGENDRGSMRSLVSLCRKGIVPMIGRGDVPKALLYVKDAAQAVERYVTDPCDHRGEVFNVSSGVYTYREMIDTICRVYGLEPIRVYVPVWFCRSVASRVRLLSRLMVAAQTRMVSGDRIARMLGYKPEYSLEDGLTDSATYYLQS